MHYFFTFFPIYLCPNRCNLLYLLMDNVVEADLQCYSLCMLISQDKCLNPELKHNSLFGSTMLIRPKLPKLWDLRFSSVEALHAVQPFLYIHFYD